MKRAPSVLLLLAFLVVGCAATADVGPSPVPPLQEGLVTVKLGEHARFGRVVLTPIRIEEDSRCPAGVECVWAGTVRVAVSVADNDELLPHPITMALGVPFLMEGGGGVTMVAVCPYPGQPNSIREDDYRLTFALGVNAPPRAADLTC
jgi:hypothetical protein